MLAAMEMALDNGADVVNMSIGSALAWPQYPTATKRRPPREEGRRCRRFIGNEGPWGCMGRRRPESARTSLASRHSTTRMRT